MVLRDRDRKIEELIEKGGSTAVQEQEGTRSLQLRPEASLVQRIDRILSEKPKGVRRSRHAWILQAIHEKLERDEREA